MTSPAVVTREKRVLSCQGNCGVILPISGRKLSSVTGGIRSMGVVSGVITVSNGLLVM